MEVLRHGMGRDADVAAEFDRLLSRSCGFDGTDMPGGVGAPGWKKHGFVDQRQAMLLLLIEYPLRVLVAVVRSRVEVSTKKMRKRL